MKKLAILTISVLASNGINAAEVGAFYPQIFNLSPISETVAVVETGVSTSWTIMPFESLATASQTRELNKSIEGINTQINKELDALIEEKVAQMFAN